MDWRRWRHEFIQSSRFSFATGQRETRNAKTQMASETITRTYRRERLTQGRLVATLCILAVALVIVAAFSIAVGSEHVGLAEIAKTVVSEITGRASDVVPV